MSWTPAALADPIVIIDYDAGNLRSVQRACAEVGARALISNDPARVRAASRIIFPGVGAAGSAMASLRRNGLADALRSAVDDGKPVLGICLGLQISLRHSEESDTETLGLIPGETHRFRLDRPELKIPHMGWNEVRPVRPHPLLDGIEPGDEFYFVHAYYPAPEDQACVYARTTYEDDFAAAVGRGNYFGVQFHPEKSGRVGLRLLDRFTRWDGQC
ncbi:MAG: imidazole glycerol phosphate synthase subunit HisH [Gammaproteobacteria bacterium]|nr:imidazole glycerol phosphate synthase subunit HisH [Gammaproteobacteria bacterium]